MNLPNGKDYAVPWEMSRGYACKHFGMRYADFQAAEKELGILPIRNVDGIEYFDATDATRINDHVWAKGKR